MNTYYTPDISELFIGYEFEFSPLDRDAWGLDFITAWHFESLDHFRRRTRFLNKERIIQEGWQYIRTEYYKYEECDYFEKEVEGTKYSLTHESSGFVSIREHILTTPGVLFEGLCPSINELNKICKLILP